MQNSIKQQRAEILEQIISSMEYKLTMRHDDSFSFEANGIPCNMLRIDDNGCCHITMQKVNGGFAYRLFNTQDRSVEESVDTALQIMKELCQCRITDIIDKLSNKLEISRVRGSTRSLYFTSKNGSDNSLFIDNNGIAKICIAGKNGRCHNIEIDVKEHNNDYIVNQIIAMATGTGMAQHSLKSSQKSHSFNEKQ